MAVEKWLPTAYPASNSDPRKDKNFSFRAPVGRWEAKELHRDPWLSDLVADTSSSDYPRAVAALSDALRTNAEGTPLPPMQCAKRRKSYLQASATAPVSCGRMWNSSSPAMSIRMATACAPP